MAIKTASDLKTLFGDVKNVYYRESSLKAADLEGKNLLLPDLIELPVLEGGVTFDTGAAEKTEVKLTTGSIWTSKIDKGDSDISFQVASVDDLINDMFLEKKSWTKSGSSTTTDVINAKFSDKSEDALVGHGYSLAPKKVTGSLIMVDESGTNYIILAEVEMFGSLVSDNDNPAYFNVSVTPVENSDGMSIMIFNKPKA